MTTVKNLAEIPSEVHFRQSFNQWSHNWTIPKKKNNKGEWRKVAHRDLDPVVVRGKGFRYALWRMRDIMVSIRDEKNRPVWKVTKITTKYATYEGVKYSTYQFSCYRVEYSIVGGMNTAGGAS